MQRRCRPSADSPRSQLRVAPARFGAQAMKLETLLVTRATLAPPELLQAGYGPLGPFSMSGRETPTFTY